MCASWREAEIDVASLTNSEEEEIILAKEHNTPDVVGTQSGQKYLKKYDEVVPSSPS